MGFPTRKQIQQALKEMENIEGSLGLEPDANALDRFRWELQQDFVRYLLRNKITQKKFAEILEIDEAKMSKILHFRIDEFSTDRLINLYLKINPEAEFKLGKKLTFS